jgi:hypothetical protein
MRQFSSPRIAVIALALGLLAARTTVAFADTALSVQQQALQPNQDQTNAVQGGSGSPYDSPDFVVPQSQIFS